jgi:preprotein translocase subunit SecA
VVLSTIDEKWKDHLYDLDHLKASISFRGWGQKDPLVEYKQEAYEMFVGLMADLRRTVAQNVFRAQIGIQPPQRPMPRQKLVLTGPSETPETAVGPPAVAQREETPPRAEAPVDAMGVAKRARIAPGAGSPPPPGLQAPAGPDPRQLTTNRDPERPKVPTHAAPGPGRNDPCPCGSGKKYKKCHGAGS